MRILADENIQDPTVQLLRLLGYDIKSVKEAGLKSATDDSVFDHAQNSERALLTYNVDFVDLRELIGKQHCGIIRLRVINQRLDHLHPVLESALNEIKDKDLKNTLVTISSSRVRIRKTTSI